MAQYGVEFLPSNLTVTGGKTEGPAQLIAQRLNEWARQGWELDQIAQIAVTQPPGCLTGLFGQKPVTIDFNCLVFKTKS